MRVLGSNFKMGNVKYSDESIKYLLKARIEIDGVVDKSDIVGALFGQTEGLLDQDMELKHLQRTGRIGRIDLNVTNVSGATKGTLEIPSSLNKIETAIIAATIESVDRVGACGCSIILDNIVDVRKYKLESITKRAAEIMKKWNIEDQNDGMNISKIVEKEAKRGRIVSFGYEKLSAGQGVYHSDQLILVEGRADVANLLKMGIENTIALGGTNVPDTVINLCKNREVTALLDGDRGGDMILKELLLNTQIEYVARAPKGFEIEHLSMKKITKALENKVEVIDSDFISERYSVVDFLRKNNRWKYLDKARDRDDRREDDRHSKYDRRSRDFKKSRFRERSDRKLRTRDKRDRKSNFRERGRDKRSDRRTKRHNMIEIPEEIKNIIDGVKQTMSAVFMDENHGTQLTVSTENVFEELNNYENQIATLVVDGVISNRLLNLANQKSIKLIAGAKIGEIDHTPKNIQYVTFNRVK